MFLFGSPLSSEYGTHDIQRQNLALGFRLKSLKPVELLHVRSETETGASDKMEVEGARPDRKDLLLKPAQP